MVSLVSEPLPKPERIHLPMVAPQIRGDCLPGGVNETRPCPWVTCRHHLESTEATCVLDVVEERGSLTLEEVGVYFGVTRERIRQIEAVVIRKLNRNSVLLPWRSD